MGKDALQQALQLANSNKRYSAMKLVRDNPTMAATVSKLIAPSIAPSYDQKGDLKPHDPDVTAFHATSKDTAQRAADAETVLELLPDLELCAQVLISCILAPKDMMTTELTFAAPEGLVPPELASALVARLQKHFEQVYKIKPLLPKILRKALVEAGSYPIAVIPENSLDELINRPHRVSMESLIEAQEVDPVTKTMRGLGFLGPSRGAALPTPVDYLKSSLESYSRYEPHQVPVERITFEGTADVPFKESYLSVSDNFNILKMPHLIARAREERVLALAGSLGSRALPSYGIENIALGNKVSDRQLSGLLYKQQSTAYNPINRLNNQEQLMRRSVGNPLIMHIPPEAVIPVHTPGAPEHQIGFFVLIDVDGNPISTSINNNYFQELQNRMNTTGSFPSSMLAKVKSQINGFTYQDPNAFDQTSRIYGQMVEADLLARLKNGLYANGVALAKREEVYRIMLARALQMQHTQLLFIPIEFMTYFAFKYTHDGVGKSLLDDMRILNSMRVMLMFSNTMAAVRNSIARTRVKLKLDEKDPDPIKSVEEFMHDIERTRQQWFPLGVNSPSDIVDYMQRAGFEFVFEGHPGLPDMSAEFEEKNSNYTKPDPELEDSFRKRSIMGFGLSPENIDAAAGPEFATIAVHNNILLSKRVITYQEIFEELTSDHARKVAMNSESLLLDLRKLLTDAIDQLREVDEEGGITEADRQGNAQSDQDAASRNSFQEAVKVAVKQKDLVEKGEVPTPAKTGQEIDQPEPPTPKGTPLGDTGFQTSDEILAKDKQPLPSEEELTRTKTGFIVESVLSAFIRGFVVTLPRPNSVTLDNQVEAMEVYSKALDAALEHWVSEKFFTDGITGEIAAQIDALIAMTKAYYMRRWMATNGVMPELSELTSKDNKGAASLNIYEMQTDHLASLMKTFTQELVRLQVIKVNANTVLDKTGATSGTGGEGGEGEDLGGGGADEFDLGGGENPDETGGEGGGEETPTPTPAPEPGPGEGNPPPAGEGEQ